MHVQLAYGRDGLSLDLPDPVDLVTPPLVPGLPDEPQALRAALRQPIQSPPLAALVHPGDRVVIAHSDITRATPNDRILPVLLAELEGAGVRRADITLLNALGTHRRQTEAELRGMLGEAVVDNYHCLQHDANDDANLVSLGVTSFGHPVRVNRHFMHAEVRILTGFIEPHFFAGFSGGPKGVLPALAGAESVLSNHGQGMIAHPNATWGVTAGNPLWEEMRDVALRAKPTFLLNVALNTRKQITGVFAGDLLAAHTAGCAFVRQTAMAPVAEPYDIVLTTNSGYPLDQNLYQTACADGVPAHGGYADLLRQAGSPQGILDMLAQPGFSQPDQWQVQIQALIQLHAEVLVYSDGLTDDQICQALFTPCRDIPQAIADRRARLGQAARVCVLPDGPQTIAYLA